jgi:hypothetical protein
MASTLAIELILAGPGPKANPTGCFKPEWAFRYWVAPNRNGPPATLWMLRGIHLVCLTRVVYEMINLLLLLLFKVGLIPNTCHHQGKETLSNASFTNRFAAMETQTDTHIPAFLARADQQVPS